MTEVAESMFAHEFYFTHHAVERYVQRVKPNANTRMALSELQSAAAQALPTDRRTRGGQRIWLVMQPPMRFITKPEDRKLIVVTIVGGHDGGEDEALDEVLEAYRRLQRVPDAGEPELVTPAPARRESSEYRAWLQTEEQRILTERARLKVANRRIEADERMRKQMEAASRDATRRAATGGDRAPAKPRSEAEKTERHRLTMAHQENKMIRWRNALLAEAAARLREVDAAGSAELLRRVEEVIGQQPMAEERSAQEATAS